MTPKARNTWMAVLVLGLLVLVILYGRARFRTAPLPEGLIQANGRMEGDRYTVAARVPGKVEQVLVREGDSVSRGQVLARLEEGQSRAKVDQARAGVQALEVEVAAAWTALATFRKQVALKIDTARAGVAHAEAALAAARARADQAARDARRFRKLWREKTVDQHRAEQAELAWKVARADYATAQAARTQAQKRLAEAELGREEIQARVQKIEALQARLEQARATLAEARSLLSDLTIEAPADGVITTRLVDPGEVVAAGGPLFDIVDLDRLYLQVYIPERQIGKVRLGLPARIHADAFPGHPFAATVRYIASRAEFTPKEVQTPDERVKLVYAVRLYLEQNPGHRLTPGLPADAVIRWRKGVPWAPPRW